MALTRSQASPRTAAVWVVLQDELARHTATGGGEPLRIVDAGGGTGGFAVPLAALGHHVTVVDPSPDALAALARRAAEHGVADRIVAVQGDADDLARLVPPAAADLVLCHSVLEVVDDPAGTLAAVSGALRVGGCASVLAANRAAAVLSKAIAGHLAAALDLLDGGPSRPGTGRRFDLETLAALVAGAGLAAERWHGVRVLADLVPGAVLETEPGAADALLALELAAAERSPYRELATQLHVLARR